MNGTWLWQSFSEPPWSTIFSGRQLNNVVRTAAPALLFGLRLWASVCLALYIAFWLELDNAVLGRHLGGDRVSAASRGVAAQGLVPHDRHRRRRRAIVVLTACFPQDRVPFLVGLALWGAGCALVATLLRNFAAYSAALAGYTVAIIASDQLGATGGLNGHAFLLAVNRASEICIGIVCAGIVLAGTDFGGAAAAAGDALFAAISAEIAGRFTGTLADRRSRISRKPRRSGASWSAASSRSTRSSTRRSGNRRNCATIRRCCRGPWTVCSRPWPAGAQWRITWSRLSGRRARQEADAVLARVPHELRSAP